MGENKGGSGPLVVHELKDGLATVTLASPPHNILTMAMLDEVRAAVEASGDAKVLLIRAEGKNFSAGADVGEHLADKVRDMLAAFHGALKAIAAYPGVTVAAVDGAALGGGCELVAVCDVVLASDRAALGQPESLLGVIPPVAAVVWPRILGYRKALELIISGERIPADKALELGLVNHVFPAADFQSEVEKYVGGLMTKSGAMMAHAKRSCLAGQSGPFERAVDEVESIYLDSLMKSHDAEEGLKAFLEKRKPEWQDK